MQLIGMMDSPFVRRVAVSMKLMRLDFEHRPISVFRGYDAFAAINPVVKAPTLVTPDGVTLMDSTLILEYAERLAPAELRLTPAFSADFTLSQRIIGLALVACEKTAQIIYERNLRPPEKQHGPWIDRVLEQLHQAYALLDAELGDGQSWLFGNRPMQADVTAAVAWRFTQYILPDTVSPSDYPAIAALSARAEALPAFAETPLD
ncbi:glutathione S-transferase [Pedomonas mirosovicensis]|uniref:glutathione S-transferase n=1 Tax=Pedomonas mirosovicensis TaxID=2908641 RepID=UPI00216968EF|nr:glutathione S-transferase [Pedomonas mirosovicensis]MCH8685141.1 glutathione S-transferase [Pedomonas mirosovicensis]